MSGKIWVTSRRGGLRGDDLLGNLWRKRGREWEGVWPIELLRSRNCFFPFLQSWLPKWERERERLRVYQAWGETLKDCGNWILRVSIGRESTHWCSFWWNVSHGSFLIRANIKYTPNYWVSINFTSKLFVISNSTCAL